MIWYPIPKQGSKRSPEIFSVTMYFLMLKHKLYLADNHSFEPDTRLLKLTI